MRKWLNISNSDYSADTESYSDVESGSDPDSDSSFVFIQPLVFSHSSRFADICDRVGESRFKNEKLIGNNRVDAAGNVLSFFVLIFISDNVVSSHSDPINVASYYPSFNFWSN